MVFTFQWFLSATAPQSLFIEALFNYKATWLVSVHGNKIADENGDTKHFFLLCSVRSTHEAEQAASVRLLCVICDLSCVDLL